MTGACPSIGRCPPLVSGGVKVGPKCDKCTSQYRSLPTSGGVKVDLSVTDARLSIGCCPPLASVPVKVDLSVTDACLSIGRCPPLASEGGPKCDRCMSQYRSLRRFKSAVCCPGSIYGRTSPVVIVTNRCSLPIVPGRQTLYLAAR